MKDMFSTKKNYDEKYDEAYYQTHCDTSQYKDYNLQNNQWNRYFSDLSKQLLNNYSPSRMLDVGCAKGFLVEKMRDFKVEAFGIDVSSYAISNVRSDLESYCLSGSILDTIFIKKLGRYNLVTCIEVLEHIPSEFADIAVANLVSLSNEIFFSSSPDDFNEETHVNVNPPEYWVDLFMKHGYCIDFRKNISIIPHSFCFIKQEFFLEYFFQNDQYLSKLKSLYGRVFNIKEFQNGKIDFSTMYALLASVYFSHEKLISNNYSLQLNDKDKQLIELEKSVIAYNKKINHMEKVLSSNISLMNNYSDSIKLLENTALNLKEELAKKSEYISILSDKLNNIYSSLTWKIYTIYSQIRQIIKFKKSNTLPSNLTIGSMVSNEYIMEDSKYCLIIYFAENNSQRYRGVLLREQFHKLGYCCDIKMYNDESLLSEISKYHIVVFQRCPINLSIDYLFKILSEHNIVTIYDIDDLVFEEKYIKHNYFLKEQSLFDTYTSSEYYNRNFKLMSMCDFIFTTTEQLKKEVNEILKKNNVFINRNAMGDDILYYSRVALEENSLYKKPNGTILIGYASGSATHNGDFKIIEKSILKILKKYKNVFLVIIGDLKLSESFDKLNVIKVPMIPWRLLPSWLSRLDINLAPLENNIFCASKSELKYFEAGVVKVPTIASNVGAFSYAIQSGKNGLLCSTEKDWFNALNFMIINKKKRLSIANAAYIHSLNNYTTSNRTFNLSKILKIIKKSKGVKNKKLRINWYLSSYAENSSCRQNLLNIISSMKDFDNNIYYLDYTKGEILNSDISIACDFSSAYFITNHISNTFRKIYLSLDLQYKGLELCSREYVLAQESYTLNIYNFVLGKDNCKEIKSKYPNYLFDCIDIGKHTNDIYKRGAITSICMQVSNAILSNYI